MTINERIGKADGWVKIVSGLYKGVWKHEGIMVPSVPDYESNTVKLIGVLEKVFWYIDIEIDSHDKDNKKYRVVGSRLAKSQYTGPYTPTLNAALIAGILKEKA